MSALLNWSESFSVGLRSLDDEHRALIASINAVCEDRTARDQIGLRSALGDLHALVERHFDHENLILSTIVRNVATTDRSPDFMKTVNNEMLMKHVADHPIALAELSQIRGMRRRHGQFHARLCDGLKQWFIAHAIKHDAHLKTIFQAIQTECPDVLRSLS